MGEGPLFPEGASTLEKIGLVGSLQQQFGPRAAVGTPAFTQQALQPPRGGGGAAGIAAALAKRRQGKEANAALAAQRQASAAKTLAEIELLRRRLAGGEALAGVFEEQASAIDRSRIPAEQPADFIGPPPAQPLPDDVQQRLQRLQSGAIAARSGAPVVDILRQAQPSPSVLAQIAQQQAQLEENRRQFDVRQPREERRVSAQEASSAAAQQRAQTGSAMLKIADAKLQIAQSEEERLQAAFEGMQSLGTSLETEVAATGKPPTTFQKLLIGGLKSGNEKIARLATQLKSVSVLTKELAAEASALGLDPSGDLSRTDFQNILKAREERLALREVTKADLRADTVVPQTQLPLWFNPTTLSHPPAPERPSTLREKGFILLDQRGIRTLFTVSRAEKILQDLTALALGGALSTGRVIEKGAFDIPPGNIPKRVVGGARLAIAKLAQTHNGRIAKQFEETKGAYLALFAQAAGQETRVSDKDAQLIAGAFPSTAGSIPLVGGLPDTRAYAQEQLNLLRANLREVRERVFFGSPLSDIPTGTPLPGGVEGGAPPTPFTGAVTLPDGTVVPFRKKTAP